MYVRNYYVEKSKDLGANTGTYTMDLPSVGALTAVAVRVYGTNHTTAHDGLHPHDVLTEIRVECAEHGIMKLFRGVEAKALNFYDGLTQGDDELAEQVDGDQDEVIWLLFGQYLGDPDFGVNLGHLTNPQLKVTWDATQTAVDGMTTATWDTATFPALTVTCYFLEDFAGFAQGFIKSQQVYTYTPANSAVEYIELPVGEPYRRILLRQYYTAKEMSDWLSNVKLNINSGALVPIDIRCRDLQDWIAQLYGPVHIAQRIEASNMDARDAHVEQYYSAAALQRGAGNYTFQVISRLGGRLRLGVRDADAGTVMTTDMHIMVDLQGHFPMHAIVIPFDKPGSIEDALQSGGYKDIQLEITAGSSAPTSGTVYVVLETIKR